MMYSINNFNSNLQQIQHLLFISFLIFLISHSSQYFSLIYYLSPLIISITNEIQNKLHKSNTKFIDIQHNNRILLKMRINQDLKKKKLWKKICPCLLYRWYQKLISLMNNKVKVLILSLDLNKKRLNNIWPSKQNCRCQKLIFLIMYQFKLLRLNSDLIHSNINGAWTLLFGNKKKWSQNHQITFMTSSIQPD